MPPNPSIDDAPTPSIVAQLDRDGFAVVADLIDAGSVVALIAQIEAAQSRIAEPRRRNLRNLFDRVPLARDLVTHPRLARLVQTVLGPDAFAVRAILFDKTPDANWFVGWHQDTAIPIAQRVADDDLPDGFGPQSTKDGVPHTRAPGTPGTPESVLERMLTARLHLDHCDEHNGPLRVIPGSHRQGRLDDEALTRCFHDHATATCPAGGALLMRPLLLHASSEARHPDNAPGHRRVLHLEFAADNLPPPLAWHQRLPIRPAATA